MLHIKKEYVKATVTCQELMTQKFMVISSGTPEELESIFLEKCFDAVPQAKTAIQEANNGAIGTTKTAILCSNQNIGDCIPNFEGMAKGQELRFTFTKTKDNYLTMSYSKTGNICK